MRDKRMAPEGISKMIEVSIIIPTLNRQKSLIRTLDSLFDQTFPQENFEIIIVDDGSTDDTEKVILELKKTHPNLCYIKQPHKGVAAARNRGINNSKGEIIGFTDDDCVAVPSWIEQAAGSLKNTEFCGVQGMILPDVKIRTKKKLFDFAQVVKHTGKEKYESYPTGNIFYRKKSLIGISGFDEELTLASDDDLAFRLIKKGCKIHFNTNMIVYHEVQYRNMMKYLLKISKRFESLALFVKKNPEFRDRFFLKVFVRMSHIYPILFIGTIIMYMVNLDIYIPLFLTIFAFLATRVFVDRNYLMMPKRILFFWKYFVMDFAGIYYALKGSIKYRTLVI